MMMNIVHSSLTVIEEQGYGCRLLTPLVRWLRQHGDAIGICAWFQCGRRWAIPVRFRLELCHFCLVMGGPDRACARLCSGVRAAPLLVGASDPR